MAEAIAKSLDNSNSAQVGYFIGYLAFNILEFFVPITKVAKVRSVNDLFKAAAPLKASVAKASGIAADAGSGFLKALEGFIAFLRRGGEGLKKLIEHIFVAIKAELLLVSTTTVSRGGYLFLLTPYTIVLAPVELAKLLLTGLAGTFRRRTQKVNGLVIRRSKDNPKEVGILYAGVLLKSSTENKVIRAYLRKLFQKNPTDDALRKKLDELAAKSKNKIDDGLTPAERKLLQTNPAKYWKGYKYEDLFKTPPKKPCFLANTLIATGKGLVNIQDINRGDLVFSYNFMNKTSELKEVLEVYNNWTDGYRRITLNDNSVVKCTTKHLFWVVNKNKWVQAMDLEINDSFLSLDANKLHVKESNYVKIKSEPTYNLHVEGNENYYVGNTSFLVHNASKVSIFSSKNKNDITLYHLFEEGDPTKKPKYAGQTTRDFDKRLAEHKASKKFKKLNVKVEGEALFNGIKRSWTPYEAAVNELYEINKIGGVKNTKTWNEKNPIGEEKFKTYKSSHNPCI